jgi:hypothetical protein
MPTREYCDGQDRPRTRVRRRKRRGRSVLRGATLSRPYRGIARTFRFGQRDETARSCVISAGTASLHAACGSPPGPTCCRHFADDGKGQVWVAGHGLATRGFANGCSAALRNTHSTTPSCVCYCRIKAIFGERRPRCHRTTEGVNSSVERLTHRLVDGRPPGGHDVSGIHGLSPRDDAIRRRGRWRAPRLVGLFACVSRPVGAAAMPGDRRRCHRRGSAPHRRSGIASRLWSEGRRRSQHRHYSATLLTPR